MAKLLEKIEPIRMAGYRFHNEAIDLLYDGVTSLSPAFVIIEGILNAYLENSNQNWIFMVINKGDLKRFNAAMKSKTDKTFIKRIRGIVQHLSNDSHYGVLFNRELIERLSKLA